MTDDREIERTAEQWTYPYMAGALDFGSHMKVSMKSRDDMKHGVEIEPQIIFHNTDPGVIGFMDDFCMEHGLSPRMRIKEKTNRLEIGRRDDIRDLLYLLRPFVLARAPVVEIFLEDLLPGLDRGLISTEDGLIELAGYIDEIREHTPQRSDVKYTQDYFKEKFSDTNR